MQVLGLLSLLFGATSSALFDLNFEPGELFGMSVDPVETQDKYKRESLQQWNTTDSRATHGEKHIKRAILNNPFYGVSKEDVKFYLYTKRNPKEPVEIWEEPGVLARTYFNRRAPVKIICHGFDANYTFGPLVKTRLAYLKYMDKVNIIAMDWSKDAGSRAIFPSLKDLTNDWYFPAAKQTESVGRRGSEMIDFLVSQGVPLGNIHMIGNSLGAHVVGAAGRNVRTGKVGRITDAVAPCFEAGRLFPTCFGHIPIKSTDAKFVDAIHTSSEFLGYKSRIGHVDFYVNGGFYQPGCRTNIFDIFDFCSHLRSIDLFTESINPRSRLIGQKCSSWENYKNRECGLRMFAKMGESCPPTAQGKYFLATKGKSPFGCGSGKSTC